MKYRIIKIKYRKTMRVLYKSPSQGHYNSLHRTRETKRAAPTE